ncbi:MAG: PDDEXK nuclease domain-containing protein [Endomicrobia bacterium]|nr:PDDEXK nuclease domain-containing protein [Endomicrobiia bacterium]
MNNNEYLSIVKDIKAKIQNARFRIALNANKELILFYWDIGKSINQKAKWGNKFVENLARDIKSDFSDIKGFSVRNLKYMSKFAKLYPNNQFVQAVLAQITWYHNIALMDKTENIKEYLWYANETIKNGWSRNVLAMQIDTELYKRQTAERKTTNFKKLLPKPQSELALQTIKDTYIFDFISARDPLIEKEVEKELVTNIAKFLVELGKGFAFVGNQYHIEVSKKDYYIDLLFYHLDLRCYIVVELKTTGFMPEYAGKLNFYLSAVDDILKKKEDKPSIGILLCADKDNLTAEYALKDINKPMGVSAYKIFERLPKEYSKLLPSVEDIKKRIELKLGKIK